ncbi:hypothetical protein DPMN_046446 [Dreissena polymorpha]|uniref:Uncharacterized protein n=2 Tax=Dreissena polymorpha TaxID=45954 RepID=A0A9D4D824_DREPO|nr:hypothetical protein DPMN_046446 [Dreissena polymorpha]
MNCEGREISKITELCSVIGNTSTKINVTLKAGRNNFGNFNATELKGCERLYELDLNFNQISEIKKHSFQNFTNLEILDLSRNDLNASQTEWPAAFLPKSLRTLIFNGLPVGETVIPRYPNLSDLSKLQTLKLDGLSDDFDIGKHTNRLKELSVSGLSFYSHCNISHISNSTFKQLLSIMKLNISASSVRSISAGAFEHLHHLEVLDLSCNRKLGFISMENISYGLQLTNIRSVNISYLYNTFGLGTELFKQDLCYLWNTSIEERVLAGNRLTVFETNAFILLPKSLTTIDVSENKFTFAPYLLQTSCVVNVRRLFAGSLHCAYNPSRYVAEDTDEGNQACEARMNSRCPYMQETFLMELASNKSCNYIHAYGRIISLETIFPLHLEF